MYVSFKSGFGYFGYVGYVMIFFIKFNHSIDLTSTVSDFQDCVFFLQSMVIIESNSESAWIWLDIVHISSYLWLGRQVFPAWNLPGTAVSYIWAGLYRWSATAARNKLCLKEFEDPSAGDFPRTEWLQGRDTYAILSPSYLLQFHALQSSIGHCNL